MLIWMHDECVPVYLKVCSPPLFSCPSYLFLGAEMQWRASLFGLCCERYYINIYIQYNILPVCFDGWSRTRKNSRAIVSANFSHQFFVGQKIRTEQPSPIVSRHNGMMRSSSFLKVWSAFKLRSLFSIESKMSRPILTISVSGTGRKSVR